MRRPRRSQEVCLSSQMLWRAKEVQRDRSENRTGKWLRGIRDQGIMGEVILMSMEFDQDRYKALLIVLGERFAKHTERHEGIAWDHVLGQIKDNHQALESLFLMEESGGEPDVIGMDSDTGEFLFVDCSPETPKGRRGVCYDEEALESRKEHRPEHSAAGLAESMGIEILTEGQYRDLQRVGRFDEKTSSWVRTPPQIRALGGALFCDRRYGTVFVYHNGASSYYGVRGFRGMLRV